MDAAVLNGEKKFQNDETYRHVHFAVMAIESGARNLGISGKEVFQLRDS